MKKPSKTSLHTLIIAIKNRAESRKRAMERENCSAAWPPAQISIKPLGISFRRSVRDQIGSSGHAAFRRFVETHRRAVAGVVLDVSPRSRSLLAYQRREAIASPAWEERFGLVATWPQDLRPVPYTFVSRCPDAVTMRSVVHDTFRFPDMRSEQVNLNVELYTNSYKLFTLLWVPHRERFKRRRFLAA